MLPREWYFPDYVHDIGHWDSIENLGYSCALVGMLSVLSFTVIGCWGKIQYASTQFQMALFDPIMISYLRGKFSFEIALAIALATIILSLLLLEYTHRLSIKRAFLFMNEMQDIVIRY